MTARRPPVWRGRTARWSDDPSPAAGTRSDGLEVRRWRRATADAPPDLFARFSVQAEVPAYDDDVYDRHLTLSDWTREETDHLLDTYRDCNGKWPVIADHYPHPDHPDRSMEELKARFYTISATLLQISNPITSMTAPEYNLYETLSKFDPARETARKKLVEAHLKRHQSEVDEESVLLSELQRIMLNQAALDSEREDLRRRLDYPHANTNGYQYSTSQALTTLWQQLLQADRLKKNQRLRPTGNPLYDGVAGATPTSARPRDSTAGLPDSATAPKGRPNRDSLTSSAAQGGLPAELSKAEQLRYGVVQSQEKLPSGVTFASDRLSKPRVAKSTLQTEKIAAVLSYAQVPELIPLPTPAVIEQFESVMTKVLLLLDMRKTREKEEQEVKVREAEKAA